MLLFLGRYVPPHLRNSGAPDTGKGYNGPPAGEKEGGRREKD